MRLACVYCEPETRGRACAAEEVFYASGSRASANLNLGVDETFPMRAGVQTSLHIPHMLDLPQRPGRLIMKTDT